MFVHFYRNVGHCQLNYGRYMYGVDHCWCMVWITAGLKNRIPQTLGVPNPEASFAAVAGSRATICLRETLTLIYRSVAFGPLQDNYNPLTLCAILVVFPVESTASSAILHH